MLLLRGVLCVPWEALCVDLIGPYTYTLKGKDSLSIDFMALTMIDPASSWLEVVELPTIARLMTRKVNGKARIIEEEIFDKSSDQISRLINKIWLCRYPRCRYFIYDCDLGSQPLRTVPQIRGWLGYGFDVVIGSNSVLISLIRAFSRWTKNTIYTF